MDIFTDNNSLAYLETTKLEALEHCWVAQLARFNYTIHYKPEPSHLNVDALSQDPPEQPQGDVDQCLEVLSQIKQVGNLNMSAFQIELQLPYRR